MSTQPEARSFFSSLTAGNWLAIFLAILAIAFIVQNRERISIDVFFVSASLPLWVSLALVFIVGWIRMLAAWPARMWPSWSSLKFASNHTSCVETSANTGVEAAT